MRIIEKLELCDGVTFTVTEPTKIFDLWVGKECTIYDPHLMLTVVNFYVGADITQRLKSQCESPPTQSPES